MIYTLEELANLDLGSDDADENVVCDCCGSEECYYEALGRLIEEHPIGVPGK